ncbi:hypothetical protein C8R45DRAFT_1180972 [Mycena sanguinolenta]|nr:hypothetical protein C8R45DRAFT_1180972 [Mycena sanguinolenta]
MRDGTPLALCGQETRVKFVSRVQSRARLRGYGVKGSVPAQRGVLDSPRRSVEEPTGESTLSPKERNEPIEMTCQRANAEIKRITKRGCREEERDEGGHAGNAEPGREGGILRILTGESARAAEVMTHSCDVHPGGDGQGRGKARRIHSERVRLEKRKPPEARMPVSSKGETGKVPLLRPLAAGSEFQRDRGHPRAPHEEVQYAEHAAPNSKGKGAKPRRHPCAAGRSVERQSASKKAGRRPRIHRQAGDRNARSPRLLRKTTSLPRREMPAPQNLSTETRKREPSQFHIPAIEKNKEKAKKMTTHPRNNCPFPPQCVALAKSTYNFSRIVIDRTTTASSSHYPLNESLSRV